MSGPNPAETPNPTPTPSPTPADPPKFQLGQPSLLGEATPGETPVVPGAPETYTDFTLPEGVALEATSLAEAKTLFKDLGLSQEGAQKLVDFHTKQLQAASAAPFDLWAKTQEDWIAEVRADSTLGKNLPATMASVAKMINTLPVETASAFREALNFTGAGNNPAIVRALFTLSQKFSEPPAGSHVSGTNPAPKAPGSKPSVAAAIYPNLVKNQ